MSDFQKDSADIRKSHFETLQKIEEFLNGKLHFLCSKISDGIIYDYYNDCPLRFEIFLLVHFH